jgi:hypothetical protein
VWIVYEGYVSIRRLRIISEHKHMSFVSSFPRNVSKIKSFLCEVEADYINMKDFPEIVSSLKEICDILEV